MSLSQITPSLFLGGADAPHNAALLSQKGITLILNATLCHASPTYPGVECVRVPVPDLPSARIGDHFEQVARRIHGNRAGGTLVHCAAGRSRSPALVMAYLMRYRGVTLREAHHWVQERRSCVRINAGFWEQLLRYEKQLFGRNTVRVAAVDVTSPPAPPPATRKRLTLVPRSPLTTQSRVATPVTTRDPVTTRAQVRTPVSEVRRGIESNRRNM